MFMGYAAPVRCLVVSKAGKGGVGFGGVHSVPLVNFCLYVKLDTN